MSNSNTPNASMQAPALIDSFQPTVRVMRLYKPGFHLIQSFPHMPQSLADNAVDFKNAGGPDFTLSPYLLLPDSFGDIYAGEKFSAYIAVVNGFAQVPFYQVTLAVRLQTSTTVIDLADTRMQSDANASKTLSCNETFDMIVAQTLNELGIHTLRVSVQYLLTPTSEVKTLRKFYRFNVLQPLVIQSSYVELNGKPMVQCEVTNATKSPIYIDELSYVPTSRSSSCIPIAALKPSKPTTENTLVMSDAALAEDLKLLQTGESCAFAFMFTEFCDLSGKPPGFPQVKWSTSMGEFSYYRGDFTYLKDSANAQTGAAAPMDPANRPIRYECFAPQSEMYVGEETEVVIRVYNTTSQAMSVHLDCKHAAAHNAAHPSTGSTIRPRLSVTPKTSHAVMQNAGKTGSDSASSVTPSTANRGLCFTGLTFTPLGIIESLDFVDVTVHVYATSAGLHDLPTFYISDSIAGETHAVVAACRVLVHDSEEWLEDGAEVESVYGEPEEKNDTAPQLMAEMLAHLPPPVVNEHTVHSPTDSSEMAATPVLPAPEIEVEEGALPEEALLDEEVPVTSSADLPEPEVTAMSELEINDSADVSTDLTPIQEPMTLVPVLSHAELSGLSLSNQVLSELEVEVEMENNDVDEPERSETSPVHLTAASSVSADLNSSMSRFLAESEQEQREMEQLLEGTAYSAHSSSKTPPLDNDDYSDIA